MPYLHLLCLVHLVTLCVVNFRTARALFATPIPVILSTAILGWANLIHTYLAASVVHLLGNATVCFLLSIGIALAHRTFFRWCCPEKPVTDGLTWPAMRLRIRQDPVAACLVGLLSLIVLAVILIASAVLPNNWDTLAYRFPRAVFYLTSNALVHAGQSIDPRITFYPFNGSIVYLFLAQYQITGVAWNFVGVVAWIGCGISAFYFPLAVGGSVRAALTSAFLVVTSPIVLCAATSTNDELLAAAPLLCGVVFLVLWYRLRSTAAGLIGCIALAISAATKLHWIFLWTFAVFCAGVAIWRFRTELTCVFRATVRLRVLAGALVFVAPLALGFLVANYVSSGKLTNKAFNDSVLNAPFRLDVAGQTLKLYSAQLFLTPIFDHAMVLGKAKGTRSYEWANEATQRFFRHVVQEVPFVHAQYKFRGLFPPDARDYYEQTLWLGLVPYLSVLAGIWILATRPKNGSVAAWLLVFSFLFFHVTISATLRYIEAVCVYYAYVAPLAFAPLGLVWDEMRLSRRIAWRALSKLFPLVLASNFLLAGALFFYSGKRDVTMAWSLRDGETPISRTGPALRAVMADARKVYIPYMHWELPFWNIMRLNPTAKYVTGEYRPEEGFDLILYSIPASHDWGGPMPVRGDRIGDFKLLGTLPATDSMLVCSAQTCREKCPHCEDYFLLHLRRDRSPGKLTLFSAAPPDGIDLKQTGFLRFTVFNRMSGKSASSDWLELAKVATFNETFVDEGYDHVLVETSCKAGPQCRVSRTVYSLQAGQRPLLDLQPDFDPSLDHLRINELFGPLERTRGSG